MFNRVKPKHLLQKMLSGDTNAFNYYFSMSHMQLLQCDTAFLREQLYRFLMNQDALQSCDPRAISEALSLYATLPEEKRKPDWLMVLHQSNRMPILDFSRQTVNAFMLLVTKHRFSREAGAIVMLFSQSKYARLWTPFFSAYAHYYFTQRIQDGCTAKDHHDIAIMLLCLAYCQGDHVATHYLALYYLSGQARPGEPLVGCESGIRLLIEAGYLEVANRMSEILRELKAHNEIQISSHAEFSALLEKQNEILASELADLFLKIDQAANIGDFISCMGSLRSASSSSSSSLSSSSTSIRSPSPRATNKPAESMSGNAKCPGDGYHSEKEGVQGDEDDQNKTKSLSTLSRGFN